MTRTPDQIKADQEFLAKARRLSPKFPSPEIAKERHKRAIENTIGRAFLALTVAAALFSIYGGKVYAIVAGVSFVAFLAVCLTASNRQFVRSGGDNGHFPG